MSRYIFDVETDGLLHELTKVHSLVLYEVDEQITYSVHGDELEYWVRKMMEADELIGHNITAFDLLALQKVYPWFTYDLDKVTDTLVLSRMLFPTIDEWDRTKGRDKVPPKRRGSHSLEAWGYRLGILKGEFGKTTDWAEWSPEMQEYCEGDVRVNSAVYARFQQEGWSQQALTMEVWFQHIMALQEQHGFPFDRNKAVNLYTKLIAERQEIDKEIAPMIPDWYVDLGTFVPKVNSEKIGYTVGVELSKVKHVSFNPGSRMQIGDRLQKLLGWKPTVFTPGGQPQIDEDVLATIDHPLAQLLAKRFLIDKRISQLSEGQGAWLRLEREGRIHGYVNTLGTVTGRCSHSSPNMAQVPAVRSLYGAECRELFYAPEGWVQVGADASGLELRCLGHYMARFDGGAYINILLNADVHTENQKAAGLDTRDQAKTFIYAFLYGAGDEKIGSIVGKGSRAGSNLKKSFLNKTPALKKLRELVIHKVKTQGYLTGIDGRKLHVRSEHAALNVLLQSAGGLLVKYATVWLYKELLDHGYKWGTDFVFVAHVHDEYQLQCRKEIAETVGELAVEAFRKAGEMFNWRCPLDGEYKIGSNWAETH